MSSDGPDAEDLRRRIAELEERLREADETLDAIRSGEVDAVIIGGPEAQKVYTLDNADRPYRILVEQMQEGALTLSVDGTILYCNRRFAEISGFRHERLIGTSIHQYVRASQASALARLMRQSAHGGGNGEFELRREDGELVPVYLSFVDLPTEGNRVLCGIVTDLTQQRQRRIAEEGQQIALEASDMGSWELDLVGDIARRSARHDEIFGYSTPLDHWSRELFLEHVLAEDRETVISSFDTAMQTGQLEFECRIRRANDGEVRWIRGKGRTYFANGRAASMAGVVTDITDQRLLEDQLRQAQKMEAVGQLTGGLAHDFNNLLTVILGNLERARLRVTDASLLRQITHASQAAQRGAGLTQQLLAFSRRQTLQAQAFSVNDRLPELRHLIERTVGEEIEVEVQAGDGLWHCWCDVNLFESAILNLVINARDAMPRGGRLTLATANVTLPETASADGSSSMIPDLVPGRYVRVTVADEGEGMSPQVQARVFEPFYTTKEVGKGSGLGLSMVYGFARQSNGYVVLDSAPGRGTTVHLYLPWTDTASIDNERSAASPHLDTEPLVILVVEDDDDVRQLATDLLTDLGHTVIEASNGHDGLDQLQRRADIQLLFTDIVMPRGMSGIDLAQEARRRRPDLAVLLTSGFTAQSRATEDGSKNEFLLVRKPYSAEEVIAAIGKAMAHAAGAGRPPKADQPAGAEPSPPQSTRQKLRVLVVEDEPLIAMTLEDMLFDLDCEVVGPFDQVAKAEAAVTSDTAENFDVALLDINVSGKTVYPVADLLTSRHIPFAFMTGHDTSHIDAAYQADHLAKPYSSQDVEKVIAALQEAISAPT
ncbi:response regulator [Pseudohoeflea coraliihabitans]|uniref:histidine kinase n=1 Tax=Pseudohoeflea coraliihabitans TaxID=2860393 RepID=A0ABS6WN72_9HYPH|nr:response regulator [Pseudohoeflea sp. DP4N28-3]MBW3097403.1 response regulator [Pseudohoeflea sp. DP4N28-3]